LMLDARIPDRPKAKKKCTSSKLFYPQDVCPELICKKLSHNFNYQLM
jgi:hypothetical protein